jgi:hypothetical protein
MIVSNNYQACFVQNRNQPHHIRLVASSNQILSKKENNDKGSYAVSIQKETMRGETICFVAVSIQKETMKQCYDLVALP